MNVALTLVALLCFASSAIGQILSGESAVVLHRSVISNGATLASAPTTSIVGTIGQSIISAVQSPTKDLSQGFWFFEREIATGSTQLANQLSLTALPAPWTASAGQLEISVPESGFLSVKIFTQDGREVGILHTGSVTTGGTIRIDVQTSPLASAHYVIRAELKTLTTLLQSEILVTVMK